VEDFRSPTGKGVHGQVGDAQALLGRRELMDDGPLKEWIQTVPSPGPEMTEVWILHGDLIGRILLRDQLRPESRGVLEELRRRHIRTVMLTGDRRLTAEAVARELGVDEVRAGLLPEQKVQAIQQLGAGGVKVAMVGDGVNDAPALATADIGIAIGAGTDVAVEAGHIVLVRSDPRDIPRIVTLSQATYRKMVQNLWWAAGYNIFAIPLAAGVLVGWGILLTPAVGAVLMSASTVVVALNAQLLRRVKL
jgi:P-type Cu2+ transporter